MARNHNRERAIKVILSARWKLLKSRSIGREHPAPRHRRDAKRRARRASRQLDRAEIEDQR